MVGWTLAAAGLIVFGLGGCETTKTTEMETAPAAPTESEFEEGGVAPPGDELISMADLGTVYFDYDRYEIRADAKPTLRANAEAIMAKEDGGTVTIEGHCDERGSEEYNLALGDRRASGVKQYLVDLGVPASRLRTVSFGEAKPAVVGHDESAWRYNRRSEFKTSP
jgi:peptidoglycan-associated lipoprotein